MFQPLMTVYGNWIAISDPTYPDGCQLLTQEEFAEASEHIEIDGDTYWDVAAAAPMCVVKSDSFGWHGGGTPFTGI
jgi:hypothetical protein